ncbi:MAG TPA: CinA family protein [Lichenihabitans sp.]|jgi:nicotinamide-nucleotide amidase|nr:CinA family protein [Lichenihabitans sp.]
MFPDDLIDRARALIGLCRAQGVILATAESCTGGLLAGLLTEISGSADVLDRGFVTYSNAAKAELLGVPASVLDRHGAVSPETALAMAEGALARSRASLALSITGVAGPTGGTPLKPVGLVQFGLARPGQPGTTTERRFGDIGRRRVREEALRQALAMLETAAQP